MKYVLDHDYHIHSFCSSCSDDPEQTPARILQAAKEKGFKRICLTDHFWDEAVPGASKWYQKQGFANIERALPLPKDDSVEFLFGCETDMDKHFTLGITKEHTEKFDFIIVATTHLHMPGFTIELNVTPEQRAQAYIDRFDAFLNMDLPFGKMGIAHLTCPLIGCVAWNNRGPHLPILDMVSDDTFKRLFSKAAEKGLGIELNFNATKLSGEELEKTLRPYRIAKACGCKFYFGSDVHRAERLPACWEHFDLTIDLLELKEEDKFIIKK